MHIINIIPDFTAMTIVLFIILLIFLFLVGGILGSIGGYTGAVFQSGDNLEIWYIKER